MIQHSRQLNAGLTSTRQETPEIWGKWAGRKHYSLEVVQHPLRARMCGFGDKDRRPLAPAAVAKMIVRREDDSIVDIDDVDCSFFLVTVDLWSADAKQEMNLVLHPSSTDRYVPTHTTTKPRRRGTSTSGPRQPGTQTPGRSSPTPSFRQSEQPSATPSTPSLSAHAPYGNQGYFSSQAPSSTENVSFPQGSPYGPQHTPSSNTSWGYSQVPPVDRSASFPPPILPSIHTFTPNPSANPGNNSTSTSPSDNWQPEPGINTYRGWNTESSYNSVDSYSNNSTTNGGDPAIRNSTSHTENRDNANSSWSNEGEQQQGNGGYTTTTYPPAAGPATYAQYPQPVPTTPPPSASSSVSTLPRHTYTRTLVGPLSANACRLLDEHRKPGIFFLFQDLSVRTEGTFRLRMRLMNVGSSPAPEPGATRIHTDVSPVLAQTFTEPFTVFSAKRFPGVPDTTALSIAFGNQGQKLPLRNRHGSNKRRRRGEDFESDDDSDDA